MGISDEDYARAKQVQLVKKLQKAYEQQQMEKEMAISTSTSLAGLLGGLGGAGGQAQNQGAGTNSYQAQQAALGAYQNSNITLNTNATNAVWSTQPQGVKVLNEQDLKHDAMVAPLSALVDMWTMRWQGEWVSENEFQEDDFWRLALIRLTGANKLEKHHLASSYYAVYRIIE